MYTETIPVRIGYCLGQAEGGFAFQAPRSVFSTRSKPLGKRAIQNCPAVNGLERQLIEIPSPVSIRMVLTMTDDGPEIDIDPVGTFVEEEKIGEIISLEPQERWRVANRPVLQIRLPFFFVTDEAAMMSLLPPFLAPAMRKWPGTMVASRFPLTIWPRDLVWAFEWDRPGEELVLRQGEPIAYALCEFDNPNKRPELVEAALTETLAEWREGMEGLDNFVEDVEEIWRGAPARRPARLLVTQDEADA